MRKLLVLLLTSLLLVSCVATKSTVEFYSNASLSGNKVYLQIDQNSKAVDSGAVGFVGAYGMAYMVPTNETIKLGTIKNKELIKSILMSDGYTLVETLDEADIVVVVENESNVEYSLVTMGFYDKNTKELLFASEGTYGVGSSIQDDLNHALAEALKSVPIFN